MPVMCKPCPRDYGRCKGKAESVKSGSCSLNGGEWTVGSTPDRYKASATKPRKVERGHLSGGPEKVGAEVAFSYTLKEQVTFFLLWNFIETHSVVWITAWECFQV